MFPGLEEPARYISALLVLDAAIAKAKGADPRDPFARAMDIEDRLAKVLTGTFYKRARKATVWAVDQVASSPVELDERGVFNLVHGIAPFFDGWDGEVADSVQVCASEAFKLGKEVGYTQAFNPHLKETPPKASQLHGLVEKAVPKGAKFLEVKPNFTQQDQAAIDAIKSHQVFWIGKFYDDKLSDRIASATKSVILDQGLSRREAAKHLQDVLTKEFGFDPEAPKGLPGSTGVSIPGTWHGSTLQYLDGLAANVVTVARNHGQIGAYHEIGVTHYEIVNPKDEKTCIVCGAMAGKVFEVSTAKTMQELEVNADYTPEQIKDYRPWARNQKDLDKLAGGQAVKPGHTSADESAKLAANGFAYAPFHFKCRCSTDVSESSELSFDQAPAKPAPPPPAAPPPPPAAAIPAPHEHPGDVHGLPTGATSPSAPLMPSGPPRPADFPWQEKQLKAKGEQLGGMHPKTVYIAPDGSEWIYKPQEEWRALVDITANDIQRLVGIEANDIYLVRFEGKVGSIQRRFANVTGTMSGVGLDKIGADEMAAIQREHMFDWLTSQHDTHVDNLLRTKAGLRGIDKGQSFRFFGEDRFDLTYGQPGEPNQSGTFYHTMFNAYASGKNVKLAPFSEVDAFLRKVESVSEADYLNAVRPYAMKAFKATHGWGGKFKTEAAFMNAVLERKQNLRGTVEKFYEDLEVRRAKALGLPAPKKLTSPPVSQVAPAAPPPAWQKRLSGAIEGKWAGSSWFVGGSDYENYHWHMYGAEGGGTFMESRLRPAADKKLRAALGILADSAKAAPVIPTDPYYADILAITKHYNYHMDPASSGYDGKIKPEVEAKAKALAATMKIITQAAASVSPDEKDAAAHYATHLSKIFDGAAFKPGALASQSDEFKLKQFVPTPKAEKPTEAKKDIPPAGWKVEKVTNSDPIGRKLQDGKIVASGKAQTSDAQQVRDGGGVYKITTPDGATIYYQPHAPNVAYSVQGSMRIHVQGEVGKLTAADVERTFRHLETVGLETREASKQDMELLYLRKVAFKEKLEKEAGAIGEALPAGEQVDKLKEMLTKKMGNHFKGEGYYNPMWESGKEGVGQPRWLGHYIDDKHLAGIQPWTSLTYSGGGTQYEKLKPVIDGGTMALSSIRERMRLGVYNGGASPTSDMESGGASMVYMRVKQRGSSVPGIFFKPDMFKDLDAVSYSYDAFGRVQPGTIVDRHTVDGLKGMTGSSGNETIHKHSLGLNAWVDRIILDSERDRTACIKQLRDKGYTHLGGRPIEDVIKTR